MCIRGITRNWLRCDDIKYHEQFMRTKLVGRVTFELSRVLATEGWTKDLKTAPSFVDHERVHISRTKRESTLYHSSSGRTNRDAWNDTASFIPRSTSPSGFVLAYVNPCSPVACTTELPYFTHRCECTQEHRNWCDSVHLRGAQSPGNTKGGCFQVHGESTGTKLIRRTESLLPGTKRGTRWKWSFRKCTNSSDSSRGAFKVAGYPFGSAYGSRSLA